jgi:hypothetical protein
MGIEGVGREIIYPSSPDEIGKSSAALKEAPMRDVWHRDGLRGYLRRCERCERRCERRKESGPGVSSFRRAVFQISILSSSDVALSRLLLFLVLLSLLVLHVALDRLFLWPVQLRRLGSVAEHF